MRDHHTVGVRSCERFVSDFDLVVKFADGWLFLLWIRGECCRFAELLAEPLEQRVIQNSDNQKADPFSRTRLQSVDDLRHDGMWHDHACCNMRPLSEALHEVDDEFRRAYDHE